MLDATNSASGNAAQVKRKPFPLRQRRKDLARLVVWLHKRLPHDGWRYIKVAAEHCPHGPNRCDALIEWLEWVGAPPVTRCQAEDILGRIPPHRWSADALGRHLRVTDFQRAILRIYTIGSYQTPKAERMRLRKETLRLAEEARRRAAGAKPREQYLAAAVSRTKPWEAFGIKRRAWERRGKPMPPTTQVRAQDSYCTPCHGLASSSDVTISNGSKRLRSGRTELAAAKTVGEEDSGEGRKGSKPALTVIPAPGSRVRHAVLMLEEVRHCAPGMEADALALAMSVRDAIGRALVQAG